jgi:hypothetical protein
MISSNKLWIAAVNDIEAQVVSRVGTEVRKAPPFFLSMLIALELYVVSNRPAFQRFLAWVRLVKVYCCLRYDDCRGIPPSRLRLTAGGLRGVIVSSKTTGPSKKVWEAPFFIHAKAGFSGWDWLQSGFNILSSAEFNFERDYLVPMPNQSWTGTVPKVMDYSSASAWGRAVLLDLQTPIVTRRGVWTEAANSPLVTHPVHLFFTEHSERHVLAGWSASLGIEKTRRDYLGRWSIGAHGSNDYVQCSRLAVLGVQREICEQISMGTDKVDELDLVDELRTFLVKRGVEEIQIDEMLSRLKTPPVGQIWFGLGQDWPLRAVAGEAEQTQPSEPEDSVMLATASGAESTLKETRAPYEDSPFWVSLTSKRKYRRLHRRGGCWLDPKIDCWDFERIDSLEGLQVDAKCINCFGRGDAQQSPAAAPSGGAMQTLEEQASSEESSSSEEAVERAGAGEPARSEPADDLEGIEDWSHASDP